MNKKEYSEAATEVIEILQYMDNEIIEKIPLEIIKKLNENKSKDYVPNIDYTDENEIKNIKPETKAILAVIYRDYLCNEDEKIEFNKILEKNDSQENEKYKIQFHNNKESSEVALNIVKEESLWNKIIRKILKK